MLSAILAATILGSIPAAVDKTLQDPPPVHLVTYGEHLVLQARVERNEKIRDSTISCIVEATVRAGGDGFSTALAGNFCETCAEQNVLGFNQEARFGLKLAQLGAEVGLCSLAAKHMHNEGGSDAHRHGKWIGRGINGAVILMNIIQSITGKPLIKWGVGEPGSLQK